MNDVHEVLRKEHYGTRRAKSRDHAWKGDSQYPSPEQVHGDCQTHSDLYPMGQRS